MISLNEKDKHLVEIAKKAIQNNYDGKKYNHTVGAALRCKSGKTYVGVNVYSNHGHVLK